MWVGPMPLLGYGCVGTRHLRVWLMGPVDAGAGRQKQLMSSAGLLASWLCLSPSAGEGVGLSPHPGLSPSHRVAALGLSQFLGSCWRWSSGRGLWSHRPLCQALSRSYGGLPPPIWVCWEQQLHLTTLFKLSFLKHKSSDPCFMHLGGRVSGGHGGV